MMISSTNTYLRGPGLTKPERYLAALTGLRAIAAYLVFLHHYNPAMPNTFAYRLLNQGYIGVSIFFILSGFLIYHRYADTYFEHVTWSWRAYLQNRFARIFPLYALLLLVTFVLSIVMGRPISLPVLGLNLTLLKGFFDEYKFSGIAQSWSLTVEICFYLLAPLLFVGLRRWGTFWLTVGLVGIGLLLWITVGQLTYHGFFGNVAFVMFYTFFGRAFEFVVGMWLARRWQHKSLPNFRFATFSGLFILSTCVLWQANVTTFTANSTTSVWSEVLVYNYILPVGIGVFFLGLLRENSIIRYLLSMPVLQALGHSSYAFYLIHIGVIASGFQKAGAINTWLLFSLLILMAYGLYVFIEKPLHQHLRA